MRALGGLDAICMEFVQSGVCGALGPSVFRGLCMHEPFAHHTDCYTTTVATEPFWRFVAYSAPCLDATN